MNPWPILAALSLAILTGLGGYWTGYRVADGKHAVAMLEAQEKERSAANAVFRKEQQRLAVQRERDELARQLEEQAYADPDADRPAFSRGSVQRINSH